MMRWHRPHGRNDLSRRATNLAPSAGGAAPPPTSMLQHCRLQARGVVRSPRGMHRAPPHHVGLVEETENSFKRRRIVAA